MQSKRISFDEMDWEVSPSGARFKVQNLGEKQLRLLEFGQNLNHPEWCLKGHTGYVLEGEMEVEFDARILRFKAGDGLYFPSGEAERHRPRAVSETVLVIFVEDV